MAGWEIGDGYPEKCGDEDGFGVPAVGNSPTREQLKISNCPMSQRQKVTVFPQMKGSPGVLSKAGNRSRKLVHRRGVLSPLELRGALEIVLEKSVLRH